MHKYRLFILLVVLSLVVVGCGKEQSSSKPDTIHITNVSSKDMYDQSHSNQAKITLSKKGNVDNVVAVNTDKDMIIAVEVPHNERFQLKKIKEDLTKEMKEKFKEQDINVELSTDLKIILELENLEKKLKNNSISKKELSKQLKHISKLLKEQT